MNSEAAMRAMVQGAPPQEPPMLQLGTFGDVPVQGQMEPPVLQLPPTEVPPAPDAAAGSRTPVNYGRAPVGTLALNAPQAETATLGNREEQKDIASEEGRVGQAAEEQAAALMNEDAARKHAQAIDLNRFLNDANKEHARDRAQIQADHDAYKQASGNLKDPSKEFWADKSTGARVLSGLAAFASGMGAGLLGQTGNPYLEYLNKMIAANYDAHKQNIEDLFQRQVQSGKIADTDDSHRQFMEKAKLAYYDFAAEDIKSRLERVKHGALGQNYKVLSDKTINGINQQQIDQRAAAGQAQASAAAAAAAARRAKQKEIEGEYKDAYKANLSAGYGEDQSRTAAAKAVQGMGYDRSLLAPIMEANGGAYNQRSGQFEFQEAPKPEGGSALIPDKDPVTGKPIKPEARAQLEQQVVRDVNGVERLVRNKEEVKPVNNQLEAIRDFKKELPRLKELQDKWESGKLDGAKEISEYEAIVGRMIPIYNSLAGSDRATPGGEVEHVLRTSVMPVTPGTTIKLGEHEANIAKLGVPGSSTGYFQKQAAKESRARIEGLEGRVKQVEKDVDARLKPVAGGAASKPDEQATEGAPAYVPKSYKKK